MRLSSEEIKSFTRGLEVDEVGTIVELGDGIARIWGLRNVMANEVLDFGNGIRGLALNLEEDSVGAIVLGDYQGLQEGGRVKRLRGVLDVPVGPALLGRVVNPLGVPLDRKGEITGTRRRPVDIRAPGIRERQPVREPLQTGIKAIDAMIPVGRGQRELIIGDQGTGKESVAIDAILNQKSTGVVCVYVAIGQKASMTAAIADIFQRQGVAESTIVVAATAADPAAMLYVAPYAACAMAEYFMYEEHKHTLVVYDDLSRHANAYRQISLLLRRPPGREAYPGDVFYLHSRLLERAARLNPEKGGGSMTALPLIETQLGDISSYIPTNVISITDGQIFLETDLFYQGIRPALNVGISVSRVGSSAQIKAMKQVAGKMKLDFAQYRELAAFAQFGSDLDEETKKKLERGKRLTEIFKQGQYAPVPVANQVLIFFAANEGLLDDLPVNKIREFEQGLYKYADAHAKAVLSEIAKTGELNDKIIEKMKKLIIKYKEGFMTD